MQVWGAYWAAFAASRQKKIEPGLHCTEIPTQINKLITLFHARSHKVRIHLAEPTVRQACLVLILN